MATTIIRRTSLALVAFAAGFANAGAYNAPACTAHPVSIACDGDNAWDVGFEAFWVAGTSNNQGYVYNDYVKAVDVNGQDGQHIVGTEHNIDADYEFGFELEGSYHFATGNDVVVAWEHADNTNHSSVEPVIQGSSTAFTTPVIGLVGEAAITGSANGKTLLDAMIGNINSGMTEIDADGWFHYDVDAVNVEFGQSIDVGNDYDLRIHGGFQYAQLDLTKNIKIVSTNSSTTNTFESRQESDFDGFGVRVGSDMAYRLTDGFSLVGHAAASLLFGEVDADWAIANTRATSSSTTRDDIAHKQSTDSIVVPSAMGKVGLNYQTDLMDGHFSIEGGWRWEGFYQVVRMDTSTHLDNFTMSGPFAAVKYVS